jgi:uncharacterized protein (DUF169 family)
MTTIEEYHDIGKELENRLKLRTFPIAVKMLENEADIPEQAFRPKRDKGVHLAQCQAFAMSRRDGVTVAMLREDNWCFAPLIAYGLEDKPDDPEIQKFLEFPRFERDRYIGILTAPLVKATFEPDLVLVYADPAQLKTMLMPLLFFGEKEPVVNSHYYPPSCAYTIVPVINENHLFVTPPDIGDDMRTMGSRDEMMISIPRDKLEEIVKGLQTALFEGADFMTSPMLKMADFDRPEFYKNLFRKWGLDLEDSPR